MKKSLIASLIGVILLAVIVVFGKLFAVASVIEVYSAPADGIEAGYISQIAKIDVDDSIIGLNETKAKEAVRAKFSDNSVTITNVERVFPNKVKVFVTVREPIAVLKLKDGGVVLTDTDFQLNRIVTAPDYDYDGVIKVNGIEVTNTFNTTDIVTLRACLLAIKSSGFSDGALAAFIDEIDFGEQIVLRLTSGGSITLQKDTSAFEAEFAQKYDTYTSLSDAARRAANL